MEYCVKKTCLVCNSNTQTLAVDDFCGRQCLDTILAKLKSENASKISDHRILTYLQKRMLDNHTEMVKLKIEYNELKRILTDNTRE